VWLDGLEISQFTYFQQVGGIDCKPISGELTYGLERIAMYLQDVDDVYDLEWSPRREATARSASAPSGSGAATTSSAPTWRCTSSSSIAYEQQCMALLGLSKEKGKGNVLVFEPNSSSGSSCPPTTAW
jgi:hypothetical protein